MWNQNSLLLLHEDPHIYNRTLHYSRTHNGHFAGAITGPRSKRPTMTKPAGCRDFDGTRRDIGCGQVEEDAAYWTLTLVMLVGRYHDCLR